MITAPHHLIIALGCVGCVTGWWVESKRVAGYRASSSLLFFFFFFVFYFSFLFMFSSNFLLRLPLLYLQLFSGSYRVAIPHSTVRGLRQGWSLSNPVCVWDRGYIVLDTDRQ